MKKLIAAPIGIDLGSYKSKISVAKRGGVQIITNEANFRETPCVVTYGPTERHIGESGFTKMKSNFRDTVVAPQRFVGLNSEYPMIWAETKYTPARNNLSDGKIKFEVNYQGQKSSLVPEQVLAAYFNQLKQIIAHNGFQNKQAVIAIPPYLTQQQRKGILTAAKIAEINATRLINESTAVALDYGIFRKNDLDATNARNVLFLDFGHSKFSIFCCSFTKQEMNVLYQVYARNVGCRDLDYLMYEFYRNYFQNISGGCDLAQNKKACVKLMEYIERQRKILTGNSEFQLNCQYLMEENDLHYCMKREQFENISRPVFNQIGDMILKAREILKEKGVNIHSIQMVGGGTRIPEFIRLVKETFGFEPSRTLNSSESVARGCGLMAAIKSPLFRVADYTLNQKAQYGVKFFWNFVEGNNFLGLNSQLYPQKQSKMIFQAGSKVPSSKTIKFTRQQAIEILIQYEPTIIGFNKHIGYLVTKPQKPKEEIFSVQFKLKYTDDGLIVFDQCNFIEQWAEQTKIPKKKEKKTVPVPVKKEGQQDIKMDSESHCEQSPAQEEQFQIKKTKKQKITNVTYDANTFQMFDEKEVHQFFTIQSTMLNQDRIIIQTYQRKNELESLVYTWKEKLSCSHQAYAEPNSIPEILNFLEQLGNWIYDEGQDANRGTYIQKIDQAKAKVNDIQKRYQAFENITYDTNQLVTCLNKNFQFVNSLDKKYQHISPEERQEVINLIESIKAWIQTSEQKQLNSPRWQMPVIIAQDIYTKIKELNEKAKKVMSKPVPKKEEEPKKEQTPTPTSNETKMDQENQNTKPNNQEQHSNPDNSIKMDEEMNA